MRQATWRRMDTTVNTSTVNDVTAWHAMPRSELVERLATNEKGLDPSEASARLQRHGPNRLPEGRKRGPFARFLAQLNNILIYVLLVAGFTKLMLSLWIDAGIIFAVVVLNALLGFVQEGKAEKALDSIRKMLSAEARTMRGGETRMIQRSSSSPVTSCSSNPATRFPRTCGSSRRRTCAPRRPPSPANPCLQKRRSSQYPRRQLSEIAEAWRFPAPWSSPGVRPG